MSTTNPKVVAIRRSVKLSYAELDALLDGAVGKLCAEKLYQRPRENEWTIIETLAHVAEMMFYSANEVAKLVAQPGQKFGRTIEDQARLAALSEHGHDSLAQIGAVLLGSYAYLDEMLSQLKDSDLQLTGQYVGYGPQTLEWFIDEFIIKHLSDHMVQIRACLVMVE